MLFTSLSIPCPDSLLPESAKGARFLRGTQGWPVAVYLEQDSLPVRQEREGWETARVAQVLNRKKLLVNKLEKQRSQKVQFSIY